MKLTVGELKEAIRDMLEGDWANYSRNAMSPETDDREAITKMTLKTVDGEDELPPHLRPQNIESDDETWGPVPPKKDRVVFHAVSDPFTNMWNVVPRPVR